MSSSASASAAASSTATTFFQQAFGLAGNCDLNRVEIERKDLSESQLRACQTAILHMYNTANAQLGAAEEENKRNITTSAQAIATLRASEQAHQAMLTAWQRLTDDSTRDAANMKDLQKQEQAAKKTHGDACAQFLKEIKGDVGAAEKAQDNANAAEKALETVQNQILALNAKLASSTKEIADANAKQLAAKATALTHKAEHDKCVKIETTNGGNLTALKDKIKFLEDAEVIANALDVLRRSSHRSDAAANALQPLFRRKILRIERNKMAFHMQPYKAVLDANLSSITTSHREVSARLAQINDSLAKQNAALQKMEEEAYAKANSPLNGELASLQAKLDAQCTQFVAIQNKSPKEEFRSQLNGLMGVMLGIRKQIIQTEERIANFKKTIQLPLGVTLRQQIHDLQQQRRDVSGQEFDLKIRRADAQVAITCFQQTPVFHYRGDGAAVAMDTSAPPAGSAAAQPNGVKRRNHETEANGKADADANAKKRRKTAHVAAAAVGGGGGGGGGSEATTSIIDGDAEMAAADSVNKLNILTKVAREELGGGGGAASEAVNDDDGDAKMAAAASPEVTLDVFPNSTLARRVMKSKLSVDGLQRIFREKSDDLRRLKQDLDLVGKEGWTVLNAYLKNSKLALANELLDWEPTVTIQTKGLSSLQLLDGATDDGRKAEVRQKLLKLMKKQSSPMED